MAAGARAGRLRWGLRASVVASAAVSALSLASPAMAAEPLGGVNLPVADPAAVVQDVTQLASAPETAVGTVETSAPVVQQATETVAAAGAPVRPALERTVEAVRQPRAQIPTVATDPVPAAQTPVPPAGDASPRRQGSPDGSAKTQDAHRRTAPREGAGRRSARGPDRAATPADLGAAKPPVGLPSGGPAGGPARRSAGSVTAVSHDRDRAPTLPEGPAPGTQASSTASFSLSFFLGGFALLAAMVCLAGSRLSLRLSDLPAARAPSGFVSALERPG